VSSPTHQLYFPTSTWHQHLPLLQFTPVSPPFFPLRAAVTDGRCSRCSQSPLFLSSMEIAEGSHTYPRALLALVLPWIFFNQSRLVQRLRRKIIRLWRSGPSRRATMRPRTRRRRATSGRGCPATVASAEVLGPSEGR
jgi:hypothetical protein